MQFEDMALVNEEDKPNGMATFAEVMMNNGADKKQKLKEAELSLRIELEAIAEKVTKLVLVQPPAKLLGYVWAQVMLNAAEKHKKKKGKERGFEFFQFVLEYLHAVWSGKVGPFPTGKLDEPKAVELLNEFEDFRAKVFPYCMVSSAATEDVEFGKADLDFRAKSTWVLIRGHRHQVLEEEFFKYVLEPHDEALKGAYGAGADEIAAGIQQIANSFRMGHAIAMEAMQEQFEKASQLQAKESISLEAAVDRLRAEDPDFDTKMNDARKDMFEGGICNVSKHTKLPATLLEDLAYQPGAEAKFFEAGPLVGTPLRTLPARIRPLVKLGDDYYATDGQFVRDSAYRAIQRGLIARNPQYRETWNKKQKALTEESFASILNNQLQNATIYNEVYFKDVDTGKWVESDAIGVMDDNLFVVEAKAGVMAMHSPATDFEKHIRVVQDLVVKAHKQCERFIKYLDSAPEVPIYTLKDGNHVEIAKLSKDSFRKIIPIGLTVEAFTPFSAMCKEMPEVQPILGRHPFISMSVDDLFVLKRFLPDAGSLFHYLDVRQQVAGLPDAMMFDEQDHLGAYVSQNRFDQTMREQLKDHDKITWDAFSEKIEKYFQEEDWDKKQAPYQKFPAELEQLLGVLNSVRPAGWLKYDAFLRDLSGSSRENLASMIRKVTPTLKEHEVRSLLFGNENPLEVFVHRPGYVVSDQEIQHRGEVACLITNKPSVEVLIAESDEHGAMTGVRVAHVNSPPAIRHDYAELLAEAEVKRRKYITVEAAKQGQGERLSKRAKRRNLGRNK